MAREIPQSKRLEVARLFFEGFSYDEVATKVGIGKGSVAAIVEDLRAGRMPQFEHVTDLVDNIREVAVGLRKANLAPAEGANLFVLLRRLVGLGVDPSRLEAWVKMCLSIPGQEGIAGSRIIQAATKLAKLEAEGLTYEAALERLGSYSAELKELDGKLQATKTALGGMEERERALTQACQGLESERERLEAELETMAERDRELSERCQKLQQEMDDRQQALARQEEKDRDLSQRVPRMEERSKALETEVAEREALLKGLEDLGFPATTLEQLKTGVAQMAEKYGSEQLVARFFEVLADYDTLLGLEATRETLTGQVDALTRQREALAGLGERLGLTADEVAEGIASLKALKKKGVSPLTIATYQGTLGRAGVAPQHFMKLVTEFGGVEQALTARRGELDAQGREIEKARRALQELRGEEASVKQSITTLRQAAVKQVREVAVLGKAEVGKLSQSLRQDINAWGNIRGEIGKYEEELRLARYFGRPPLSEAALSNLVEDINALIVLQYLAIIRAWCRKKLNPKLKPPRDITRKYFQISEHTPVELADLITWVSMAIVEGLSGDSKRA